MRAPSSRGAPSAAHVLPAKWVVDADAEAPSGGQ